MKILIVSDIHANPWALAEIEQTVFPVDRVLFLGDAVNYGPRPAEVVDWLLDHQAIGVRGNHDHAVGFSQDPNASPSKAPLALAMRAWTEARLSTKQLGYLQGLPLSLVWEILGVRFALIHATPDDPLYDYRLSPTASEDLLAAWNQCLTAEVVLFGHTHLAFSRAYAGRVWANPGSVGQPLDGDPRAGYAVWQDGTLTLGRVDYDRAPLLAALEQVPLEPPMLSELKSIYQRAGLG